MKSIIATGAVAGLLFLGVAGPTMAATPSDSSSSVGITPQGVGEPTNQSNDAVMARLNALRGTQTDAQIQAILTSGKPSESLFDSTAGKYVAAYLTGAVVSPFTIVPRGPGCATTDACAYSGGTIPHGYSGTGSLAISVPNVTRASAGNILTTFWYSASQGVYIAANNSINISPALNFVKITRG